MFRYSLIMLSLIYSSFLNGSSWHDRRCEGWAYYEEIQKEELSEQKPPAVKQFELSEEERVAEEVLERVQKSLKAKLAMAILDPSPENIRDYQLFQRLWSDKSSDFSSAVSLSLISDPELYFMGKGMNESNLGIRTKRDIREGKIKKLCKYLSKDYGVFLFYQGENIYSKEFSTTARDFCKQYGFDLLGISMDGRFLPTIDTNQLDNGISEAFHVDAAPSMYLVNFHTNEKRLIAIGYTAFKNIEENIALHFQNLLENMDD
ncbi:conjugal transfer protein TraF [Chlamydiales bacterium]|nr:conjugal transfer protein TraF [Chlamydiales bacterium]